MYKFSKTHIFWKYKIKNNDNKIIEYYFLKKEINNNSKYIFENNLFEIDGLVYRDSILIRHYKQNYQQKRLNGNIISAKFCSNYKDIILMINLETKFFQFRLLRYNEKHEIIIQIDPFIVNIKYKSSSSSSTLPIYNISPVLIPPCSDYLYILYENNLSIYSIYTSQKVYLNINMNSSYFSITNDHKFFSFINNNNNNNDIIINKIINKKIKISQSYLNAIILSKCTRINRTEWKYRKQNHAFLQYKTGDYHREINKIVQNIVDTIFI